MQMILQRFALDVVLVCYQMYVPRVVQVFHGVDLVVNFQNVMVN